MKKKTYAAPSLELYSFVPENNMVAETTGIGGSTENDVDKTETTKKKEFSSWDSQSPW